MTAFDRLFARFCTMIRREAEGQGMSLHELARRAKMHEPNVVDMLNRRRFATHGPTLKTMHRLAEALGCELVLELRKR